MKKVILSVGLFSSLLLVGCGQSNGYSKAGQATIASAGQEQTFDVQDGDILYRNGVQLLVFEDVQTGKYTVSNEGHFELLRKN